MQEILKAKETLPRSFIEKLICFDRLKEYLSKNSLTGEIVKTFLEETHERFDDMKTT